MCEELNDMLEEGHRLATEMVWHTVHGMGAGGCTIPVEVDGIAYEVEVRRWTPVEEGAYDCNAH